MSGTLTNPGKDYETLIGENAAINTKIANYQKKVDDLIAKKATLVGYQTTYNAEKTKITNFDLSCSSTWSGSKRDAADGIMEKIDTNMTTYGTDIVTLIGEIDSATTKFNSKIIAERAKLNVVGTPVTLTVPKSY